MNKNILVVIAGLCLCLASCREESEIIQEEIIPVAPPDVNAELIGFYLLNEGNMGSNKSTLDYMDLTTGEYHRNIFADANPTVPKELGDVGNDIGIYGSKLYAVINCSNKVEVMDKFTAKRIGQINIPNCRYIKFYEGYAYVTSYAGPVEINPDYEQIGYVAKVDTTTYQVVARCLVGFQPDELEIVDFPLEGGLRGAKIYVANSGGYMVPNYESTVSVIDIPSFTETKRIEVAINLHRLKADRHGNLWVSSRGDYYDEPSRLYWIDTKTDTYGGMLPVAATELCLDGDSLYLYSTEFSYNKMDWTITFGIIDVTKKELVTRNFITDGTDKQITMPYGLWVHPVTKDIYMTDAANYIYPGAVICYDKNGKKQWQERAGDIPAHFAPLWK
jgi:DNA-binding beta-propeller fold protein YncE